MSRDAARTPELAEREGDWWRRGGIVLALSGAVVSVTLGGLWAAVLLVAAAHCIIESADAFGWRRGYLAREREELKRRVQQTEAGD